MTIPHVIGLLLRVSEGGQQEAFRDGYRRQRLAIEALIGAFFQQVVWVDLRAHAESKRKQMTFWKQLPVKKY